MSKKIRKNKKNKKKGSVHYSAKSKNVAQPGMFLTVDQTYQLAAQNFQGGNLLQAELLCQQILTVDKHHADTNHLQGIIAAQQEGGTDIAIQFIRKAIMANPDYAEAHKNLGNIFQESGRLDEAIVSYGKALSINPGFAEVYNNLGVALQNSEKREEAIASYGKALAINPDYAEALNNLGVVLQESGRTEEAVACYRKAVYLKPDYAEAYFNLGNVSHDSGRIEEAVACYRRAVYLKPDYTKAYNNLGVLLQNSNKIEEAIACHRHAVVLKADFTEAHLNLGLALHKSGQTDKAIASYRKALSLEPDHVEAFFNLGIALHKSGQTDEAISSYRKALTLKPDYAEAHFNLGNAFHESARMDEAVACYKKALSIKPDFVEAFRHLSLIVKHTQSSDDIHAMDALFARDDQSDEDKMRLGFALGKVFEDLKDYDKSFGFILEANRLKRESYAYSIQTDQDLFARITKTFSSAFLSSHYGSGNQDAIPVFILGMPRSGTTLVEQILSSHPLVFGAGELGILANLTTKICSKATTGQYPECIADLDADLFEKMGSDYMDEIRKYSKEAEYITNKMPHNFLFLGLIKLILPNAKVIHCMRNPMDNCLSLFKNFFSKKGTHKYAYDMVELGHYYNLYRSLMDHWEKVLPGFMYSLRYEEMVVDQQNQTGRLLEFCGLPWDEACLAFHKTERRVKTASFAQVRKPIYNDSLELWKRYETQLAPLRKAINSESGY